MPRHTGRLIKKCQAFSQPENAMSASTSDTGFALLKRLAQKPVAVERCGLCNVPLPPEHRHLVEPQGRRIECACNACALLFENQTGRYRLVPRDAELLRDFALDDLQWEALGLPINLTFFFYNSTRGGIVALYPSPAGATESLLPLDAWQEIVNRNPRLEALQPDVEALLVNRTATPHEYFIAPIDRCYALVGIIRRYWRGFSGGDEVWSQIAEFFRALVPSARREAASNA
jgi:hypothetical protein